MMMMPCQWSLLMVVAYVYPAWSAYDHTLIVGFGVLRPSESRYPASGTLAVSNQLASYVYFF